MMVVRYHWSSSSDGTAIQVFQTKLIRILYHLVHLMGQVAFCGVGNNTKCQKEEDGQGVDPMAEKFPGWRPYNYAFGNPLRFARPAPSRPSQHA